MTKRRVHLDSGAVFLRSALTFFIARELFVWLFWLRWRPLRPGIRLLVFLFKNWATPHSVLYSVLFAGGLTFALNLCVRLILAPLVQLWHAPRSDDSAGLFHLSANEWVVESSPGRRKSGWRWLPGTLVRTNLRIWFFPRAHLEENWSRPLKAVQEARLEPVPRVAWGWIVDWPDRVVVPDGDGADEVFAVADPDAVLSWLRPAEARSQAVAAVHPDAVPLSTPRRL